MSANKFRPHVYLIPEDEANRQLAIGFLGFYGVVNRVVELRDPAGGWLSVLEVFETEYIRLVRGNENAHVVMLIDFDDKVVEDRRVLFENRIPNDLRSRVFLIGSKDTPETLKAEFGMSWENIGRELAQDCQRGDLGRWNHPHLIHNSTELQRMVTVVKPFLFQ